MSGKPSIVFAQGLWADGSCFSKVIELLKDPRRVPHRQRRQARRHGRPVLHRLAAALRSGACGGKERLQ